MAYVKLGSRPDFISSDEIDDADFQKRQDLKILVLALLNSDAQRNVLSMSFNGLSSRQIGERLGISFQRAAQLLETAVKNSRANVRRYLSHCF